MAREILEMTPKDGEPLKDWLATALTRFAIGGVTIGEICDSWLQFLPTLPTLPTLPIQAPQAPDMNTENKELKFDSFDFLEELIEYIFEVQKTASFSEVYELKEEVRQSLLNSEFGKRYLQALHKIEKLRISHVKALLEIQEFKKK